MSLMDMLLSAPSAQDRYAQALQMMQPSAGPRDPRGLGDLVQPYQGDAGPIDLANEIARRLENKGFQVGGLEGFDGTGQVSSGHIEGSQHYTGHAGDVNYYGGGRWPNEVAALNWVENWLNRKYGDAITENIWQEPGHYGHLHYGTRPGG